ncbi:31053_t:CDS:2 [Gigaspora margarita]|uniref:31053_t:CDS:1 n=1 Tax=Gigaspora margarita TaxID=4874 RepID=A0ABM8VYB6_GIGMA|nr:31053_t:CDS:2 [Gigaspora margarita]
MSTNFFNMLSQDYKNLAENSDFSDIKIQVGKRPKNEVSFYAHSLILRACSPYFQEVLLMEDNNIDSGKVLLFDKPNITPELYIYDGTIDLTSVDFSDIVFLLWGAHEFRLSELCNYIEDEIIRQKDLVMKNISLIYKKGLLEFTKLTELCKYIFKSNDILFSLNRSIISISASASITSTLALTKQPTIQSNIIKQPTI